MKIPLPAVFLSLLIFAPRLLSLAQGTQADDSTRTEKKEKISHTRLVVRLHSLGQFSYGGRIVTDNPVMDLNFTYNRRTWGLQIFKAQDLRDPGTPMNFTLAVVNKNFRLGKRLTITPSAGVVLEQCKTIADHGSDAALIITTAYKVSPEITLDQSMLFANLVVEPELRDWVNRFRFLYSRKHVDITLSLWHNNTAFDAAEYVTTAANVSYSRVRLGKHVSMSAGISGLLVANATEPTKNGLYLTLATVFD